jgi:hypothetical protein
MAQEKKGLTAISDWIRKSLEIYFKKENLIYLTKFGLLQLLAMGVFYLITFIVFGTGFINPEDPSSLQKANPAAFLPLIAGFLVFMLFNLWVYVATLQAISQVIDGKILGVKETLQSSIKKFLPVLFTGILTGIIILIGFILLIVPGFIFLIWFYFAQYLIIFEKLGPVSALKRSRQLVKGYFWPVAIRVAVLFGYVWVLTMIANAVLKEFMSSIVFTIMNPYFYVMPYLLFKELKEIKK